MSGLAAALAAGGRQARPAALEIAFRNDPCVLDGRFANNGWLQELPKPITKLTWDNAVLVSPATAEQLAGDDAVPCDARRRARPDRQRRSSSFATAAAPCAAPLFPVAGHPDDCVTVHLGYGRTRGGQVGSGAGFNANAIRTSDALWIGRGVEIVDDRRRRIRWRARSLTTRWKAAAWSARVTRDEFVRDPHVVHEGHRGAAARR